MSDSCKMWQRKKKNRLLNLPTEWRGSKLTFPFNLKSKVWKASECQHWCITGMFIFPSLQIYGKTWRGCFPSLLQWELWNGRNMNYKMHLVLAEDLWKLYFLDAADELPFNFCFLLICFGFKPLSDGTGYLRLMLWSGMDTFLHFTSTSCIFVLSACQCEHLYTHMLSCIKNSPETATAAWARVSLN